MAVCFAPILQNLAAAQAAPANASSNKAPWYQGSFSGQAWENNKPIAVTVNCDNANSCTFKFGAAENNDNGLEPITISNVQNVDPAMPNSNWAIAKDAVKRNPKIYDESNDSLLLKSLRPMLESGAEIESCVGKAVTSDSADGPVIFCKLKVNKSRLPNTLVLMQTMNGSCNSQVFCAYYFIAVQRATAKK
jgi:hypothetical protein